MTLVERLEKVAVELDRTRWTTDPLMCEPDKLMYDPRVVELCDLLREAAKKLKKHERTH